MAERNRLLPKSSSDACRSFSKAENVVFDQHHMTLTWASIKKTGVWYSMGCAFAEPTKLDPYGMTLVADYEFEVVAAPTR